MDRLPDEILRKIFHGLLSTEDHLMMRLVCRRFSQLSVHRPVLLLRMLGYKEADFYTLNSSPTIEEIIQTTEEHLKRTPSIFHRFCNLKYKEGIEDFEKNVDVFNRDSPATRVVLSAIRKVRSWDKKHRDKVFGFINKHMHIENIDIYTGIENIHEIACPERIRKISVSGHCSTGPPEIPGGEFFKQTFSGLEKLIMSEVLLRDMHSFWGGFRTLKSLALHDCFDRQSEFDGRDFALFTNLEALVISSFIGPGTIIAPLLSEHIPKIKKLTLRYHRGEVPNGHQRMVPVEEISLMENLEMVDFSTAGYRLDEVFMSDLVHLTCLDIKLNSFYGDDGLEFLYPLENTLKELHVMFWGAYQDSVVDFKIFDCFSSLEILTFESDWSSDHKIRAINPDALVVPSNIIERKLRVVLIYTNFVTTGEFKYRVTDSDPFHSTEEKDIYMFGVKGIQEDLKRSRESLQ